MLGIQDGEFLNVYKLEYANKKNLLTISPVFPGFCKKVFYFS